MAQEMKELCALLFPDSLEKQEELLEISDYVKKLGSHSWEEIHKEPERLSEELKQLTEQTQELAFTNYKTFVETAGVSKTILTDLSTAKDSLKEFQKTMPTFIKECDNFSLTIENIMQEKSRYSSIRSQSDKLLELLELPSLMREALNAEDYESALDIFTFIRNMSNRYSEISLVQNVKTDIMTLWFETVYHLFNQLRYDLPLPQCLQILGYLRRANTVYKSTDGHKGDDIYYPSKNSGSDGLDLHFLKARNAWFESALEDAKNTETPDRLLKRIVELHRLHLFNILTQHKSIFLSDSQESKGKDDELNGTSALSSWLKEKVDVLVQTLDKELPKEDESSLESLFNQCMYLCLSFGRVGADMRCALTPLFRKNVILIFHSSIEKADLQFENQMRTYKVPSIKNVPRPSDTTLHSQPENLLDHYPLAEYYNSMVTILNSLRVTAPLNIVKDVYNAFRKSFVKAVQVLLEYYKREQQAFTDVERQNYVLFIVSFCDDLVPYLVKCLAQSFPLALVAEQVGVTLTVLQDSKILNIDYVKICEPLNTITGMNIQ